jgi:acetyl-CoA carboxylase carboxyl transferase subunit beta
MNWLSNFIRPKISSIIGERKDVPDNLWQKCPVCDGMLFHRDLKESQKVCYHCGHHLNMNIQDRLDHLFDDGKYTETKIDKVALDPLKFKDRKRYVDRLKEAQAKTKREDAYVIASGTVKGQKLVVMLFNFAFQGGSMGAAVGEAIVRASEEAIKSKSGFMVIPASGGARMQEGLISLMQMPRSIIAVKRVKAAGLPYIVLLTNPTTGGVSASFAMVGDVHIAEPGAMIGFAGKRVIQETIREELPENFQTAEYLLEHGMVDMVVPRAEQRDTIARILDMLTNPTDSQLPDGDDSKDKDEKAKSKKVEKAKKKASETVADKARTVAKVKVVQEELDASSLPDPTNDEELSPVVTAPSSEKIAAQK